MNNDTTYLKHIVDAAEKILLYSKDGRAAFLADPKTQDAVIRNLQVVGEAAKKISESTRTEHPEIPWREMTGMRNKLVHDYVGIDLDLVWQVVEKEIPGVRSAITEALATMPSQ